MANLPRHTEILLRKEDNTSQRKALKEKFVSIYEAFFKGEDPSDGNANFWEELFLLKVNFAFLERCVILTSEDQLLSLQTNMHKIFIKSIQTLQSSNKTRQARALETLTIILKSIFRKKFANFGVDVVTLLSGMDAADQQWPLLFEAIAEILKNGDSELRMGGLLLLEVIISATDNISQNTLLEYIMIVDIFDPLLTVILEAVAESALEPPSSSSSSLAFELSSAAVYVLAMLSNYQKYDTANLYLRHLAELNDRKVLLAIAQVLERAFFKINRQYELSTTASSSGIFSKLGGYLWSAPAPAPAAPPLAHAPGVSLLALYELVYVNHHFAHTAFSASGVASPASSPQPAAVGTSTVPETLPTVTPSSVVAPSSPRLTSADATLVQGFLRVCSFVFSDLKDPHPSPVPYSQLYPKLCLLILTCMCENEKALAVIHDPALQCKVNLYKGTFAAGSDGSAALVRRNSATALNAPAQASADPAAAATPAAVSQSDVIACAVLDVVLNFLRFNLKAAKPALDQYVRAIGLVHRLVCYQKRVGIRLAYNWKELWHCLFLILRFCTAQGTSSNGTYALGDLLPLVHTTVTLFNLFITYGDTFLPSPSDYDDLYYDLMRQSRIIEAVHAMLEQAAPANPAAANPILLGLANIKTIIAHFTSKLDLWSVANPEVSLTPDQVLKVIKNNYDSLKLKLQENLDYFDTYIENPKEVAFFRQLTRSIIVDKKASLQARSITVQTQVSAQTAAPLAPAPPLAPDHAATAPMSSGNS